MHTPLMVVAIAAFFVLLHLGHIFGMLIVQKPELTVTDEDREVKERRGAAAGIAYGLAAAAALVYGLTQQIKAGRVTYWATIAILFFGLSTVIYAIVPKIYHKDPTAEYQERHVRAARLSNTVTAVALFGAVGAWAIARGTMAPLSTKHRLKEKGVKSQVQVSSLE
jgi:uncharacterized membrane protein